MFGSPTGIFSSPSSTTPSPASSGKGVRRSRDSTDLEDDTEGPKVLNCPLPPKGIFSQDVTPGMSIFQPGGYRGYEDQEPWYKNVTEAPIDPAITGRAFDPLTIKSVEWQQRLKCVLMADTDEGLQMRRESDLMSIYLMDQLDDRPFPALSTEDERITVQGVLTISPDRPRLWFAVGLLPDGVTVMRDCFFLRAEGRAGIVLDDLRRFLRACILVNDARLIELEGHWRDGVATNVIPRGKSPPSIEEIVAILPQLMKSFSSEQSGNRLSALFEGVGLVDELAVLHRYASAALILWSEALLLPTLSKVPPTVAFQVAPLDSDLPPSLYLILTEGKHSQLTSLESFQAEESSPLAVVLIDIAMWLDAARLVRKDHFISRGLTL